MVLVPYFLPGGGISGEGAPVPSHNASSRQQDQNEKLVLDGANEEIVKECAQSITDLRGCIRKQEAEVKEKQDQIRSLLDACQVGINEFTNDGFTAQASLDYHRRTLDTLKAFGEDFESIIDSMLQTQRKVVFNILSIHLSSIKAIQCDDAQQKDINKNKTEQVASLQAEIADPKATIANHESEKEALQETINSQQSDIEELARTTTYVLFNNLT